MTHNFTQFQKTPKSELIDICMVKVFRIIIEYRIMRLTFHNVGLKLLNYPDYNSFSEFEAQAVGPQERSISRSGVRSAMRAASKLPGRVPLIWMMPLHLQVNQKSDYDYI